MASQWYLLGKEIDHRLKIYFRANSSIDRILYRIILGNIALLIYFNFLNLIPGDLIKHFFWGTWVVLGLFYSWPTRGKIIEESVTSQLEEFKFLDRFEKTVLFLALVLFIISIPEIPALENIEAFKLIIDPSEEIHPQLWNFLSVNYYPFVKFPKVYALAWSLHLYFIGIGFYLLALYGILRFFVSRRLSILGVFSLISSWSFSKILQADVGASLTTTYSLIWIWSLVFCTKSSTYRSGLFMGLVCYWGTLIHQNFAFLLPIQLILLNLFLVKERTKWYRMQTMKYSILGIILTFISFFSHADTAFSYKGIGIVEIVTQSVAFLDQKAFFWLAGFGLIIVLSSRFANRFNQLSKLRMDTTKLNEVLISFLIIAVVSIILERSLLNHFGLLWVFVLLSLIPLEWIFQGITRLRSRRNIIYVLYILICLLDSHFEGRLKILNKFF
ncbi:MAG: hypothetical protein JNM93_10215 [Bacteriovoracaceae bacterium]|nr:hypothetical protein [Bacteriovoracaceae bacterium]